MDLSTCFCKKFKKYFRNQEMQESCQTVLFCSVACPHGLRKMLVLIYNIHPNGTCGPHPTFTNPHPFDSIATKNSKCAKG